MSEHPDDARGGWLAGTRSRRLSRLAVLLAVGGVGAALLGWARGDEAPPEGLLYANGRLEAVAVRVGAEVTGRVTESFLVEGSRVAPGDVLVELDDAEPRIALAEAQAQSQALRRAVDRVGHQLAVWRHHCETAGANRDRAESLRAAGIASDQLRDRAEDEYQDARGRVASLEAEQRENEARLEAARRRADLAREQVDKSTVRAPVAGTILTRAIEVGELAVPGRVVAELADLDELELRVFVPEPQVGKVRVGAEARVQVDAFPGRTLPARVARVDQEAQFTPKEVHMPEERVRLVFGVVLTVSNPEGFLKPGMPADAWIRWREQVPWPELLTVPR